MRWFLHGSTMVALPVLEGSKGRKRTRRAGLAQSERRKAREELLFGQALVNLNSLDRSSRQ